MADFTSATPGGGGGNGQRALMPWERAKAAATARVADPELRALLDAQRVLENQVAALKLRKESMDPAEYDRESEKLLTELALKTRAIRERTASQSGSQK